MSGSVKLNWSVPAEEWKRFRHYVEHKHGQIKGYVAREAERAMLEYAEADEYAGVEDKIDRLLKASGELGLGDEKKNNSVEIDRDGETVQVGCRVSERAKDAFRSHVAQTELRLGIAFAHAIQLRRDGGRPSRLEDKLDRIVDEAESLLKVNDDTRDAGESMTKKERQTVAVCRDVRETLEQKGDTDPDTIPKKYVEQSIKDLLCDETTSDPYDYYIPTYMETVKERLGYVTPPEAPGLLKKEELVGQTPPHERKKYADLSTEERIDAVKIELGRQAIRNGGRRQQDVQHFREQLFDGKPRESTVKNYMRQAGEYGGFSTTKLHGKLKMKCKLEEVADEELLEYIENGEPTTKRGGQQTMSDIGEDRGQQAIATDGGSYEVGKK